MLPKRSYVNECHFLFLICCCAAGHNMKVVIKVAPTQWNIRFASLGMNNQTLKTVGIFQVVITLFKRALCHIQSDHSCFISLLAWMNGLTTEGMQIGVWKRRRKFYGRYQRATMTCHHFPAAASAAQSDFTILGGDDGRLLSIVNCSTLARNFLVQSSYDLKSD